MKRQNEELIFKYKTKPQQVGGYGILFAFPVEYNPIPGDIVEMIISENAEVGGASYYAHLVCFKNEYAEDHEIYLSVLNGHLLNKNLNMADIDSSVLSLYGDGYAVELYVKDSSVPAYVSNSECIVNLIIHRSKSKFELYYL